MGIEIVIPLMFVVFLLFLGCVVMIPNKPENTRAKTSKELPDKDPMDWSLTESSTPWKKEFYCPTCKSEIGHDELMSSICNTCGSFHNLLRYQRTHRMIVQNGKWIRQYKYGNGPKDYELED